MNLEELVKYLRGRGADPTPADLAELLWLAARSPATAMPKEVGELPPAPSKDRPVGSMATPPPSESIASKPAPVVDIGMVVDEDGEAIPKIAGQRAKGKLRRREYHGPALPMMRGLSRLGRMDDIGHPVVDLEVSVRLWAETRQRQVVMRPLRLPATALLVLEDAAGTMDPWRAKIERVVALARSSGRFFRVEHRRVKLRSEGPEVLLATRVGALEQTGEIPQSPAPDGWVVWWVSDGIAAGVRGGALRELLKGKRAAWIHPWGVEAMWSTPVRMMEVSPSAQGALPLTELTGTGLGALSQWIGGDVATRLPAVHLPEGVAARRAAPMDAASYVRRIRQITDRYGPAAGRLIGLAAAIPGRFDMDLLLAVGAAAAETPVGPLDLARALASGLLVRDAPGWPAMIRFVDEAARTTALGLLPRERVPKVLEVLVEELDSERASAYGIPYEIVVAIHDGREAVGEVGEAQAGVTALREIVQAAGLWGGLPEWVRSLLSRRGSQAVDHYSDVDVSGATGLDGSLTANPMLLSDKATEINAADQPFGVSLPADEAQAQATRGGAAGRGPIRVLHLSDLHFSAKTAWDSGTVLGRLTADVTRLRAEVGELHLVVVTGDIANFGTAEEYAQATAWLTGPLAAAAGVTPAQIRVVPGNHDVRRGSINRTATVLAKGLLSDDDPQQAIAEVLSSETERAPFLARQSAYLTFAQTFHPGLTVPWWSERYEIQGLTVHLAGFNSAWLSASDNDRGNLVVSRWQCHQLLAGADTADLTIALLHHPWDYLHESDQESEEEIRRRCGIILHGHLHQQRARLTSELDRDVLQLAAGASYAGSKWANSYQLLDLDPMRGEARVHFRLWDGFDWIPDRNRYQKALDGLATLPLRYSPNAPKTLHDADPTVDITDDSTLVRTLRDRYAFLLRERVVALPDVFQVAGGPALVEGVYVAVRLSGKASALDREAGAAFGDGHRHAQHHIGDRTGRRVAPEHPEPLESVLHRPHTRWVLLGDPGSGKTTVLRHAALKLLDDPDGKLPIYLTVAEIEQGIEPALRRLFERFGAADLTRWAHKEVLEGRAVLLLDGLDEVADLGAARRALLKLAVNVGKTTTLVIASRPTGYKALSIDFVTLALCPLGVEEQRALLSRWVPDDARVTAALARLSRTPRLRRLAENPLLLTIAGLVLRAGKDVPQRRAELYELALDVLIHRRHAPDGLLGPQLSAPGLAMELLGWAALRLHGQEGDVYPRGALIAALEADPRSRERLQKQWRDSEAFIAEVAERTGLLIPDTGRVRDANAYSFPQRFFREFLAATALERDMGAVGAGARSGAGELSRVLAEGKARPERWAEVLALTCGRLGPGGADALVQRISKEGNTALLLRVVADAEGISAETIRGTLKLELGWRMKQLEARQKVIEEIPALVKDLAVAVGLLEQVARSSTCGHDLFWVREVLRRIARGNVAGGVLDGSVEDAKRAAKGAADNVLSHLDPAKREALLALLKPWWREIPAGSFEMGGDERDDEKPQHRVTFTSGFLILGVPVTWTMYRLFDPSHDSASSNFGGKFPPKSQDEVPVYNVSWYASVMFAEWVGARLPLEPEWEYACRAGTKTRFWSGDADADLARVGWTAQNSAEHAHPVAQKPKNAWGLHDVHGNVWEWCTDAWDENAYTARADGLTVDPQRSTFAVGGGPPESAETANRGASRVVRGGSWRIELGYARTARRICEAPSFTDWDLGFRLLLPPPERTVALPNPSSLRSPTKSPASTRVVSPSLIALLHRLFADHQGELAHALQRREWAAGLVQKLPPHERTDPDAWFHQLTQRVQLEKRETALLDLLRELREERRPEIDAVAVELAQRTDTPAASSPRQSGPPPGQAPR